ncbi:MAG: deoxyguanosinetriphosphate triphosphohydrolase [Capsulimonadaceae bacterium]
MSVVDVPPGSFREYTESVEDLTLSPYAVRACRSRGRARFEEPDPVRTAFQRDRDRILHSKAFRRLKHKTQVFIDPDEDHYRTRLTHTLEVAQIARTTARALRLNEDLTEGIALGHDLGHPPFGHMGERALDDVLQEYLPGVHFRHYDQSLRIVDVLERDGLGLNLTWEVRDGILGHSKGGADLGHSPAESSPSSLEGMCVRFADRIAYINHDIQDAVSAGVLRLADLPREALDILGHTHSDRIASMVINVLESSAGRPEVRMTGAVLDATNSLKNYMYANVYTPESRGRRELEEAQNMLKQLFRLYMGESHLFSQDEEFRTGSFDALALPDRALAVTDFLSGMTDRYLVTTYRRHFGDAPGDLA